MWEICYVWIMWCCIGVTRSRKIEPDRDIRKTRNVFKNLRFCAKGKDCARQLTCILKRLTLIRLQTFTSLMVTFKILNSNPCYGVDRHFLYEFSFHHELGSFRNANFFHQSLTDRRPSLEKSPGLVTESPGVVLKRGRVYLRVFSLGCPLG